MKKLLIGIILTILLTGFVIADDLEYTIKDNLDKIDLTQAPGIFKFLLGSPKVNLEVERENGNESLFGFVVKDGMVKEFKPGGVEGPDYIVKTHEKHITKETLDNLPELYASGEIQIIPQKFFGKIKFGIVKLFI